MKMTIVSYQIDGVLKAYSRQSKAGAAALPDPKTPVPGQVDKVEITLPELSKTETFDKLSYSLTEILLTSKEK
jgi:hypothetical protein